MPETPLERQVTDLRWEVKNLEGALRLTNQTVIRIESDLIDLKDKRTDDSLAFAKFVTTIETAAKAAEKVADKAITSRQLYVSLTIATCAVVALILGLK